jgi:hypothetical protein
VKLVTVEEKKRIEEQDCFAMACDLFSPFPSRKKGLLDPVDAADGSYKSSRNELFGVTPEQQRKIAVDAFKVLTVFSYQTKFISSIVPESSGYRSEITRVLRL